MCVRIPIGTAMHFAANRPKWTGGHIGETIYVYALWIMKRMGNDSTGIKINRKGLVEAWLEIPLGGKGGGLGNNIHIPVVTNDERTLRTSCDCEPD